jgi:hypothetical protein
VDQFGRIPDVDREHQGPGPHPRWINGPSLGAAHEHAGRHDHWIQCARVVGTDEKAD